MDLSSEMLKTLRQSGLRLTPQRLAIFQLLTNSKQHPTVQMIYDQLRPQYPSLSLATVYNTLDMLVQLGLVNALGSASDDAVHYDADTHPLTKMSPPNLAIRSWEPA